MNVKILSAVALLATGRTATASFDRIAGYAPGSKVTDHNAIDQDQKAMEAALGNTVVGYNAANMVYTQGGFSKSYATFKLGSGLTTAVAKQDPVRGVNANDEAISGFVYADASIDATEIKVGYSTSEDQATYMNCKVGGLGSSKVITGCFKVGTNIVIDANGTDLNLAVTGSIVNSNGRTIQGFSTGAEAKMYSACPGCPYKDFLMYYEYYGDFNYADKWVTAALAGTATGFTGGRGDADFSLVNDDATRVEAAKKGSVTMNVWMYVVREFEDAIDDCKSDCGIDCNDAPVHAWDEGVAFYTGSLEGSDGSTPGKLLYALANKRCQNYKTCGLAGDAVTGRSKVNSELSDLFALGQHKLLQGECDAVRPIVNQITAQMTIPLIQGTLRYAYKVEFTSTPYNILKEKSEGATFAAAVLPRLHSCSAADAETVYNNMRIGATATVFANVRAAFENNYACLNISCADVGGLVLTSGLYYDDFAPCVDPTTTTTTTTTPPGVASTDDEISDSAMSYIIAGVVAAVIFLLVIVVLVYKERKGSPVFHKLNQVNG